MPILRKRVPEAVRARLERLAESWAIPAATVAASAPPVERARALRLDARAWRALAALLAGAMAIAAWSWWNGRPLEAEAAPVAVVADGVPASTIEVDTGQAAGQAAGLVTVHVIGSVREPGLVELPAGSRVADAVDAAGGATRERALASVNLARVLVDGEQIVVGAAGGAAAAGGSAAGGGSLVSLSLADAAALEDLPGIGPVLAQRIVDWRTAHGPFVTVDALGDVPGIGPSLLGQVRPLVSP